MNQSEIRNLHPCFNRASGKGRMHLPVCPDCNIGCKFCARGVGGEGRAAVPGLASELIVPEQAANYVAQALKEVPEITVVGIAGPGDSLATDHAFRAFKKIRERFPKLIHCMSTNGLLLPEKIGGVVDAGVSTLTVTVNAVSASVLSKINSFVHYHGEMFLGEEAGEILIENQLKGIRLAADAGILVKVNTVLVPGINDEHIPAVAKAVSDAGANIFNIIPLIPQFLFAEKKEPSCEEIDKARTSAEEFVPVFRHCQHCRADAIGLLGGEDIGGRIYKKRIEETFSHG